jgi:small subunit ribosomal protein S8e
MYYTPAQPIHVKLGKCVIFKPLGNLGSKTYKGAGIFEYKMVITQSRSKRRHTGSRYVPYRKKKLYEIGGQPISTTVGEDELKKPRVKGGQAKVKRSKASMANVTDPTTKKTSKVKINSVAENAANRHFVRRNIITKGAIIETEKGKARVTSRPGQDGLVNAVLVA